MNKNIPDQQPESAYGAMYYGYNSRGPDPDISAACLNQIEPVYRSQAGMYDRGRISGTSTTVRDGMTRADYDFYRPGEAIPKKVKAAIAASDEAYMNNGVLHNIIDLMADFGSQGIEIFHPSKVKEKRYRHWFRKVCGKERSERFLNLLYRHGNVIVKRAYADLNIGDIDDLERGIAGRTPADPEDIPYKRGPKIFKNRIPLQYTFMNPTAVEVVGGDLAMFAGDPTYALRLPESIIKAIKSPKTPEEVRLVGLLPSYITAPVRAGKKMIPLDMSKIQVFHYKKDDWLQWAYPMAHSILPDLKLYEKHKLADLAALDGAITHIRLWRLGLPEYKIQPGPLAFARLREQLRMAVGGGSMDLIWDASLDLKETSTDVYRFLGMQKYEPCLQAIYAGLGIPQNLTGGKDGGSMGAGSLSLKTLVERLQYGRDLLMRFWNNELMIMQEAFGDRQPARLHFDNMSLSDEANEKMLWMHLVDRDIVSVEMMREKFGAIPEVEEARIRREYAARTERTLPPKVSPYHDVQPDLAKQKIALQTGVVSPQQVDTPVETNAGGDKLIDVQKQQMDLQEKQANRDHQLQKKQLEVQQEQGDQLHQQKLQQNDDLHQQRLSQKETEHKAMLPIKKQAAKKKLSQAQPKGTPGQGRPRGANDQGKRKTRTAKAAWDMMNTQMWARGAQKEISDTLTPAYLERCKKKSMRNLTTAQADELEEIKFRILCSIKMGEPMSQEAILAKFDDLPAPDREADDLMKSFIHNAITVGGINPTIDEVRDMQATAYAILHAEGGDDGDSDIDG
jgi:hypothetical protein